MLILLQKPHSFVDLITNSSTELYVIDRSKTEEAFKEFIDSLMSMSNIDSESSICKFTDSYQSEYMEVPEGYNPDDLYVLNVNYHNHLLEKLLSHFHVVNSMHE